MRWLFERLRRLLRERSRRAKAAKAARDRMKALRERDPFIY